MSQMIEVKTAELEGAALDWAIGKVEAGDNWENEFFRLGWLQRWAPSTDWSQGGLLIDEHRVLFGQHFGVFVATIPGLAPTHAAGETHLIASCRVIVAAKLGDTVQVPAELVTP